MSYVVYAVTAQEWFDGREATVTRGVLWTVAGEAFPFFRVSR